MKRKLMALVLSLLMLVLSAGTLGGCSDEEKRGKSIPEKLDSDDNKEKMEGIGEAGKKYGGEK